MKWNWNGFLWLYNFLHLQWCWKTEWLWCCKTFFSRVSTFPNRLLCHECNRSTWLHPSPEPCWVNMFRTCNFPTLMLGMHWSHLTKHHLKAGQEVLCPIYSLSQQWGWRNTWAQYTFGMQHGNKAAICMCVQLTNSTVMLTKLTKRKTESSPQNKFIKKCASLYLLSSVMYLDYKSL